MFGEFEIPDYLGIFLFLVLAIWMIPVMVMAAEDECYLVTLRVKVEESREYEYQEPNQYTKESYKKHGGGEVRFLTGGGKMEIIHKSLSGTMEDKGYREDSCVIYEWNDTGTLVEYRGPKKSYGAYWRITYDGRGHPKPIKGCMQDPIPPIKGTDESFMDHRFEGIVIPGFGIYGLCEEVKNNPALGVCMETKDGSMSGYKIVHYGGGEVLSGGLTGTEQYEWKVERVSCRCNAYVELVKGDVLLNGQPIRVGMEFNLSKAVIETIGRSLVGIKMSDGSQLRLGSNTKIDLSGFCKELEKKPSLLKRLEMKVSRGLFNLVLKLLPEETIILPTAVNGVRGKIEEQNVLLASAGEFLFIPWIQLVKEGVQTSYDDLDLDKPLPQDIKAAIVYEYRPEEGFLRIEVIHGKVKLRDSSGFEKLLMEGEKFKKTWSPHAPREEFKTIEAYVLP